MAHPTTFKADLLPGDLSLLDDFAVLQLARHSPATATWGDGGYKWVAPRETLAHPPRTLARSASTADGPVDNDGSDRSRRAAKKGGWRKDNERAELEQEKRDARRDRRCCTLRSCSVPNPGPSQ